MKIKVLQYSSDGIFLRTFDSFSAAAKFAGTDTSSISKAVKNGIKAKNYYWKKDEGRKPLKIIVSKYRRGGRQIIIYKNNKYFCEASTISEASEITGIPQSTIRSNCRGVKIKNNLFSFKEKGENT